MTDKLSDSEVIALTKLVNAEGELPMRRIAANTLGSLLGKELVRVFTVADQSPHRLRHMVAITPEGIGAHASWSTR